MKRLVTSSSSEEEQCPPRLNQVLNKNCAHQLSLGATEGHNNSDTGDKKVSHLNSSFQHVAAESSESTEQLPMDSNRNLARSNCVNYPDTAAAFNQHLTLSQEGNINNTHSLAELDLSRLKETHRSDCENPLVSQSVQLRTAGRSEKKKVKLALQHDGELTLLVCQQSNEMQHATKVLSKAATTEVVATSSIERENSSHSGCSNGNKVLQSHQYELINGSTCGKVISEDNALTSETADTYTSNRQPSTNLSKLQAQSPPVSLPQKLKTSVTFDTSSSPDSLHDLSQSNTPAITPKSTGLVNPGFVFEFPPKRNFHAFEKTDDSSGVIIPQSINSPSLLDVLHKKYWANNPLRNDSLSTDVSTSGGSDSTLPRNRRDSYKKSIGTDNDFCTATLPASHSIKMFGNLDHINLMFNTMPAKSNFEPKTRPGLAVDDCVVRPVVSSSTFLTVPTDKPQNAKLARKFSLSPKVIRKKIIARLQPEQGDKNSSDSEEDLSRRKENTHAKRKDTALGCAPASIRMETSKKLSRGMLESLLQGLPSAMELEALGACTWLREAGFPQYVQLFEDSQFPIDLKAVESDHAFLDKQLLEALFRRVKILNKSVHMKLDINNKKPYGAEDEEEETCVLSDKWHYERASGRWSHIDTSVPAKAGMTSCSSRDSIMTDDTGDETGDSASPLLHTHDPLHLDFSATLGDDSSVSPNGSKVQKEQSGRKVSRTESFFLRVGTLRKSKKPKPAPTNVTISGPTLITSQEVEEKMHKLGCVQIIPNSDCDILNNNVKMIRSASLEDTCACDSCSLPDNTPAKYILPLDYRIGTFPKVLESAPVHSPSRSNSLRDRPHKCQSNISSTETVESNSSQQVVQRRHSHDNAMSKKNGNRRSIYDNLPDSLIEDEVLPSVTDNIVTDNRAKEVEAARRNLDAILKDLFLSFDIPNVDPEQPLTTDSAIVSPSDDFSSLTDGSPSQTPNDTPEMSRVAEKSVSSNQMDSESSEEELAEGKDSLAGSESVWRERRDSGVGPSLPRGRKSKQRLRWHSFVYSHRPSFNSQNLHSSGLSAGQLMYLRRLSLLKVTSLMEQYSPSHKSGWTLLMNKFIKKGSRTPDYTDKKVFSVPLSVVLQRTGQPLPQCILHAMRFLRKSAPEAVGIFRKSGVKSRIQKLRNDLEQDPDNTAQFDSMQAYDVADMFKQYLRELPECLLTNKLSDTFLAIYQHVPQDLRLEALQACILLLPDENREVLESVLYFLSDMAAYSSENHMNESNLAMCFAPSLFNIHNGSRDKSPKSYRKNTGIPDGAEQEQKSATDCLTSMIVDCKKVFKIPDDFLSKCCLSYMEVGDPAPLALLGLNGSDYNSHIDSCIQGLVKEMKDKGWTAFPLTYASTVDVCYKKVHDGNPLRLWKCSTEIEAPPEEVLHRVVNEQQKWDEDFTKWRVVEKLDKNVDVFHYMCNSMPPQPARDYCVLRAWKTDLAKGACALVTHSIDYETTSLGAGIRGIVMASRYLIEPCGSGKSKITHISRVDNRGRSAEWYNRSYGHLCASSLVKVKESFTKSQDAVNVAETKV